MEWFVLMDDVNSGRVFRVDNYVVYISPNWSIIDKINARTTMQAKIVDLNEILSINVGDSVTFENNGSVIFAGLIQTIDVSEEGPGYLVYNIKCVDNTAITDRRVIAKVYENEYVGDIVTDLITEVLGEEGITAGTIQDGPVIAKAVFNYIKCSQALDYLKTTTGGYIWNIDKDKKLNFFERSTNTAPWTLDNTVQHNSFKQLSTIDTYRNTQYVRGGQGRTNEQSDETPTPKPDGESRSFILRFPIANEPAIEINLNGAGWVAIASSDIGINGLNDGKKWYWSYNSQVITQDETEVVLGTVDAIRITYVGLRNLFVKIDDPAEVLARATVESNSGIYEDFQIEKSINTAVQALEYADGLIQTYAEIKDKITFSTEVSGLEAGQLLTVNKTLYGISDNFLIESITIKPKDSLSFEYTVSALDGASIGGWEEFFKNILKAGRDFSIAENEVIITMRSDTEIEGLEGDLNIKIFNASYPSDTSYPGETEYPNDEVVTEVDLSD